MPIYSIDKNGNEHSRFNLLVYKQKGEWKLERLTETGERIPELNSYTGKLIVPETGYTCRPGIRNLVFEKSLTDKEWKLTAIIDYEEVLALRAND